MAQRHSGWKSRGMDGEWSSLHTWHVVLWLPKFRFCDVACTFCWHHSTDFVFTSAVCLEEVWVFIVMEIWKARNIIHWIHLFHLFPSFPYEKIATTLGSTPSSMISATKLQLARLVVPRSQRWNVDLETWAEKSGLFHIREMEMELSYIIMYIIIWYYIIQYPVYHIVTILSYYYNITILLSYMCRRILASRTTAELILAFQLWNAMEGGLVDHLHLDVAKVLAPPNIIK